MGSGNTAEGEEHFQKYLIKAIHTYLHSITFITQDKKKSEAQQIYEQVGLIGLKAGVIKALLIVKKD